MNDKKIIKEIHAFIAVDDEGHEGLMAFWNPKEGWTPMVAADRERLESLRVYADNIQLASGNDYVIRRFISTDEEEVKKSNRKVKTSV